MCNDLGEGSRCCAFYSATGIVFTLWVGVMITTQPFFIGGIEDADKAQKSAFGAMAMFIVTFAASMAGIWYDSSSKPEPSTTGMDGPEAEYQLAQGDTPTYGTSLS